VHERHVHRTRVVFEDGTTVTGVSFVADDPYRRDVLPSFGLYLDERWRPPWPHAHVDWPDFNVPTDTDAARRALVQLVERARRGEAVEVGCLGGHGRTGTALACIAVLTGTSASDAVTWVRANYCDRAVETDEQAIFASDFTL
jgi:protein-tyrosine phosphatase